MTKLQLCIVGIVQEFLGAAVCLLASVVFSLDGPERACMGVFGLGVTMAISGHALCKASCVAEDHSKSKCQGNGKSEIEN